MAEQARRITARRQKTRKRVLDAARDLFAERGVLGSSIEDISSAANFTRGAFYSNFPDKVSVVRELLVPDYERLLTIMDLAFAQPEGLFGIKLDPGVDPLEVVRPVVALFLAVASDRKVLLVQAELELAAIRLPELATEYGDLVSAGRDRFADFLVRALGRLGRELTVAPADAADALVAILQYSGRRALLLMDDPRSGGLAGRILPGFLVGISRPIQTPAAPAPNSTQP
jgi:AcrR family transcriptional regulator